MKTIHKDELLKFIGEHAAVSPEDEQLILKTIVEEISKSPVEEFSLQDILGLGFKALKQIASECFKTPK